MESVPTMHLLSMVIVASTEIFQFTINKQVENSINLRSMFYFICKHTYNVDINFFMDAYVTV